jgi:hypothetical protein
MDFSRKSTIIGIVLILALAGASAAIFVTRPHDEAPEPTTTYDTVAKPPAVTTAVAPGSGGTETTERVEQQSFSFDLPPGAIDYSAIGGGIETIEYQRGPVKVTIAAQEEISGQTIADVTRLYGDWTKAEKISVGGKRGYLFQSASGPYTVYTAVTVAKGHVYTIQVAAPKRAAGTARDEIAAAASRLKPRAS